MSISIGHLGPRGTYSEQAALAYRAWLASQQHSDITLTTYPSILQAIQAVAAGEVSCAIVPVENSIEGTVAVTLDTLWQLDSLRIQRALVLPIRHTFITHAKETAQVETIYSHPQALGQCQQWIARECPIATLIPTRSTTESLQHLEESPTIAAIASEWAASLYQVPVLARSINDRPDNCTKFWILNQEHSQEGSHTSLAFSLPINCPGALLRPLEIFAEADINLSRIESRPTKRSLGEYLFFLDLEASLTSAHTQDALKNLENCTETLKLFGSYATIPVASGVAE
ncbi:prephenate dehydratase [Oscillatoria sp. CS-180]|uniref:prephenate dehydratase n=1 Tax=Oscillatoria sp. CS-180 TaxID=3021720 RepID=UPI00232DEA62|nr:prephenate dehydratase [Oscillatoria sp. CS-180]MDB9529171.1 prephenate dehydratase [Oscillatoria sp. CS-180]